jgi:hypothetical protein
MDAKTNQTRKLFFSDQNEAMLLTLLTKNFQQRLSSSLNEKETVRLERGLEHYMSEVFQNNSNQPVQVLNKEVITATASDFQDYLQRQASLTSVAATETNFQETSQRFDQLLQNRQRGNEPSRPPVPEYVQRITLEEDNSVSALTAFEEAKKRRNQEMSSQMEQQLAKRTASASQSIYAQDSAQSQQRPDPRQLFDQPLDMVIRGTELPRELPGRGDGNPTIARSGDVAASRGSLPQDMLIKQQDIQSYKETEYNLSIYSADRKWEFNTNAGENRYNFHVNLYSGNPTNGISVAPKGTARFRNITRIEFVKAIMPIEGLDVVVLKNSATMGDNNTSLFSTVFSLPFVALSIDELDNNNYGTNSYVDKAFGLLQYDANWISDTNAGTISGSSQTYDPALSGNRGYVSMIPKHLKCQRVYTPTPLATLTKLSVRLQRPDGSLLSDTLDTLDISGIFIGNSAASYINSAYLTVSNSYYQDTSGEFIWIDANTNFSRFTVAQGDRIVIRNLSISNPTVAQTDFLTYLQRASGHIVVNIAYMRYVSGSPKQQIVTDGANPIGYARFIIIRNQFRDPTTGAITLLPFGGQATNTSLGTSLVTLNFAPGRLLNLSHQTQLIFRVITRDYDSTSLVRPDNL